MTGKLESNQLVTWPTPPPGIRNTYLLVSWQKRSKAQVIDRENVLLIAFTHIPCRVQPEAVDALAYQFVESDAPVRL
jgi:hypothetical protein